MTLIGGGWEGAEANSTQLEHSSCNVSVVILDETQVILIKS